MLWHLSREPHKKIPHHQTGPRCKSFQRNHCPPGHFEVKKSHHSDVSAKISKPQHDPPDNPLGVVPKPAIDPIRAQQVERKSAAASFRFLWELYKCLINKKVGWWRKIPLFNFRDVVVLEFWIFLSNCWRVYVPPKNTCRSKWFRFYVGFLVGILIDGAS